MAIDYRLLEKLERRSEMQSLMPVAQSEKREGGGKPPDQGVGQRLTALEASFASMEKTMSVVAEQIEQFATRQDVQSVKTELAVVSGKMDVSFATFSGKLETTLVSLSSEIDRMVSATDLAELKGRVARIPTVPVLTSILVFVALLFAAASWAFRHLPPAWTTAFQ